jgi:cytochrome c556
MFVKMALPVVAAGLVLAAPTAVPTVHDSMTRDIAPQAQILRDVSNRAMDAEGNPSPSKLTGAHWQQLGDAAARMKEAALALASGERVAVVGDGAKIDGEGNEGASTAAQVQGFIDSNPQGFRSDAEQLAAAADALIQAAAARDASKLFDVSGRLDQVCEQCHVRFWYPQQSKGG